MNIAEHKLLYIKSEQQLETETSLQAAKSTLHLLQEDQAQRPRTLGVASRFELIRPDQGQGAAVKTCSVVFEVSF